MIKVSLIVIYLSVISFHAFAGDLDFVYVDSRISHNATPIHDSPIRAMPRPGLSIAVDSLRDFADLAERYSVEVMFREQSEIRSSSAKTTTFFFPDAGMLYSFTHENYDTLADLQDGLRNGFDDGRAYYHAQRLGMSNPADYERFHRSWFIRNEDRLQYLNTKSNEDFGISEYVVLPERISDSDFHGDFLLIMVRHLIRNGYAPPRNSEAYQTLGDRGMLTSDPILRRNDQGRVVSRTSGTVIKPDLPFFDLEYAVTVVHTYLNEQLQQAWVRSGTDNLSRLSLPPYWASEGGYELRAEDSVIWWGDVAEGVLYHFASWNRIGDIPNYVEYINAKVAGFNTIEDRERGQSRGFIDGTDYYDAQRLGFDTFLHYDTARTMNLLDIERYARYQTLVESLTETKHQFNLDSFRDALIVDGFSRLESGRTVSLQRIVESINSDIRAYPAIGRLGRGWLEISQRTVDWLVARHPELFESIGVISAEDSVFTRR